MGLHRQAIDADDGGLSPALAAILVVGAIGVPAGLGQDGVGDIVLARAVGLHDGGHHVLGHVLVVGEQLLRIFREAVATIAEGGVVVVGAHAGVQAHALDDARGVQAPGARVGVELVEVGDAQREERVGEELHGLGLGGAHDEHGGLVLRALGEQVREAPGCLHGLRVGLVGAHDDAGGVEVVVEGPPLAQELGAEEDATIAQALAQLRGVADGDGGLHDDPRLGARRADGGHGRLHARGVEEVARRVVVRRGGHDGEVDALVPLPRVQRRRERERALPRGGPGERLLDLGVPYGALPPGERLDLRGDDVHRHDLAPPRQQHRQRQPHVPGARDRYPHAFTSSVVKVLEPNKTRYTRLLMYPSVAFALGMILQGLPKTMLCEGTSQFT